MSEFKGTKGEWKWDKECVSSKDKNIDGNIICESPISFNRSMVNWESNAKLIAAAPELLEVLQELMLTYEEKGQLLSFNIDIARQAIKKATE